MSVVIKISKGKRATVAPVEDAADQWLAGLYRSITATISEWRLADGRPTASRYEEFLKVYKKRHPVDVQDRSVASGLSHVAKNLGREVWLAQADKRGLL